LNTSAIEDNAKKGKYSGADIQIIKDQQNDYQQSQHATDLQNSELNTPIIVSDSDP